MSTVTEEPQTLSLADQVRKRNYWSQRITLPGGIVTPGWSPISPESYRIPADLAGKRVLDVGAGDGYWTFEALRRGAREVLAIDDFSDSLGKLRTEDRTGWENFDLCRNAFGYPRAVCNRKEMSVYDVTPENIGMFDIVFFFGTFYRLRHPLLALDRLSAVCKEEIFVESAISDDFSPYRGGIGKGYPNNQIVMEFYPDDQYGNNAANWWSPTLMCMAQMVRAAGFPNSEGWKLTVSPPQELPHCRGFVRGRKNAA